jgi:chemotaxis protein MotB
MFSDHEEKTEGAPVWMVSFADMITILLAFFVVMFSIASDNTNSDKRSKQQETAIESLQYRFGPKWKPFMTWSIMPGNSNMPGGGKGQGSTLPVPAVGDPGGTMIVKKKERARIRVAGQGDTIAIGGLVMFQPSSAKLVVGQEKTIDRIAEDLAGKQQVVEIVATASNRALPPDNPYHDRWELGYARCRAVANLLTARTIEPSRFRLSVVPGNDAGSGDKNSEADDGVRVNLSTTLSPGGK